MYLHVPKRAPTTHVQRQVACGAQRSLLLVTGFSSRQKQFCHEAKSNELPHSSYQVEQQASAHAHAAAVHTVFMGAPACTHKARSKAAVCVPPLRELLHDHAGKLMFLHTNMSPKWNLAIPADFSFYSRRWQVSSCQTCTFSFLHCSTGKFCCDAYASAHTRSLSYTQPCRSCKRQWQIFVALLLPRSKVCQLVTLSV